MSRERVVWGVGVVLLLVAGLLIGRLSLPAGGTEEGAVEPFRQRLWEERGVDLVAQVGLIFAGALGIAALLPRQKEEEDV